LLFIKNIMYFAEDILPNIGG